MKILIIGDLHMRYELPCAALIADGRKSEWTAVKRRIHSTAESCDAVVLLGDQLNSRHNHSSVLRELIEFLKGFGDKEVHLLCGNHERFGKETALDFIKKFERKNWFVHTEPKVVMLNKEIEVFMVPFMTPALLGVESLEDGAKAILDLSLRSGKLPLAFAHQAISGAKSTEFFNEIILDKNSLRERFDFVFAGHLHQSEKMGKDIQITGSVLTAEVGEHTKQIYVWDTETKKSEEVPLPVRGIYKVDWNADPEKIFGGIPADSIVKCFVKTKGTDIELVKETLNRFTASIIVEQYPDEREKVHFEDNGLDLSLESLLKLYAVARNMDYADLKEGYNLIK